MASRGGNQPKKIQQEECLILWYGGWSVDSLKRIFRVSKSAIHNFLIKTDAAVYHKDGLKRVNEPWMNKILRKKWS